MTLRIVWEKANVDVYTGDNEDGVAQYESRILHRNEAVPDEASDFTRQLLLSIGAAKDDGYAAMLVNTARDAEAAGVPAPVLTPDQPPAPMAPSGGFGDFAGASEPTGRQDVVTATSGPVEPAAETEPTAPDGELPTRPADRDLKPVWEEYAVALGIDRATAESKSKADLIVAADARRVQLEQPQA